MPKAQSAMEYLTTYGWAILIIAVVIIALDALGIFNPSAFVSRAQPGSCSVYRPYGPGTAQLVNLQGVCSTEEPRTVAAFNGRTSQINILNAGLFGLTNQLSVSAWVYSNSSSPTSQDVVSKANSNTNTGYLIGTTNGWSSASVSLDVNGVWQTVSGSYPGINTWNYVAATYNGYAINLYVNGALVSSGSAAGNVIVNNNNLTIGSGPNYFSGWISNVQLYNTTLSANEIQQNYLKGIGGPPANLQNLVGWWPLNSDVNDYSGNQDNGVSNTIYFFSSWNNRYNQP